MPTVCLYLKAHQPRRIRRFGVFDIGSKSDYFQTEEERLDNDKILKKIIQKSYIPTNALLLKLLKTVPGFSLSLSLTGVLLDQLEEADTSVIVQFQELVATGKVEILGETYHHSLSYFYDKDEFESQVQQHRERIMALFGVEPKIFSNTELAYNNDLALWADKAGYDGVVAEGWDPILQWRSPNYVYQPVGTEHIKVLLKNYKLSDDIAFRFSERTWPEWPLTVDTFVSWIHALEDDAQTVNLFMDYETFGEHQWEETGIFDFLASFPEAFLKNSKNSFMTPSEVIKTYPSVGYIDVPQILTWADTDRDLSAWIGNKMQRDAIEQIYALRSRIYAASSHDPKILYDWQHMLTSDHFYYMCTKWFSDGDVHAYFNPYESPYDACIAYMNVLKDIEMRLERIEAKPAKKVSASGKKKANPVE